ncbi:DamX protein [Pseudoalteromonas sp. BSi20652]|uniref:SPOR domain-containing protein n=1 Tax=Pseudoalteromonas sp. BSi20652 TaxID=388384 RepID=UPI0002316AB8|nr:AAA family ATPase [Pseudoalteromonas sp. BSi20652]GAA59759.1 DamX protein [Pseudoalteromonas sp. BSi20652]
MQSQILPSRAALVDRIALQFEYGQNLIVLLGTSGLGKSYMLETFITDKYNDFNKAFMQINAKMTDTQLMSDLLEQSFNAPLVDHNLSLSENYYQLLKQQQPRPCLWVLDGGRHLSEEILIELELLSKNSPSTLYIMIACTSKLPFNNAVEIYLERLTLSESKKLMGWYFTSLPYDEDPVFQAFLAEANGNPSLLLSWQADEHVANIIVKDKVSWRLHLMILMLLIMFLIIGFLYRSDMTQWWQQYYQQEKVEVNTTAILASQVSVASPSPSPKQEQSTSEVSNTPTEMQEHHNDVPSIMQSLSIVSNNVDPVISVKELSEPQSLADKDVINTLAQSSALVSKDLSNEDDFWYQQQPESNTVIQLLAVTQQQVADDFIKQYSLQDIAHTYQTKKSNNTWWVITTGSFTNLNDAKLGMRNLPEGILKNKPFYKKISKIKQEIALLAR